MYLQPLQLQSQNLPCTQNQTNSIQWYHNHFSLGKMKGNKKNNRNANGRSAPTKSASTSAKKSGGAAAVKGQRSRLTWPQR
jgi:hypothetical protein